jgi:hypothetical protein
MSWERRFSLVARPRADNRFIRIVSVHQAAPDGLGPTSQSPRDMPPLPPPDEASGQPPCTGNALDGLGIGMRWNTGRSQSVRSTASYDRAAATTADVRRHDAGGAAPLEPSPSQP